jgi:hypothetical protein
MVSMPSGMMTMSEVPTRTPVPSSVTMRSWRCDRDSDRGKIPARKELELSVDYMCGVRRGETHAMAMRVLRVSSIKSPSHMVKSVREEEKAWMWAREEKRREAAGWDVNQCCPCRGNARGVGGGRGLRKC